MDCRICFQPGGELLSPCQCRGTAEFIHRHCLRQYIHHYPDRICRTCLVPFRVKREDNHRDMLSLAGVSLTCLLFSSSDPMLIKLLLLFLLLATLVVYQVNYLYDDTTWVVSIILCVLFLQQVRVDIGIIWIGILSFSAVCYSLAQYIPEEYLLRVAATLLVYAYILMLTIAVFTAIDRFAFTVYGIVLFMTWYATLRGHNPLRLILH